MENFELLSDDELRVKLLQYGFANLPITQTTRKTLIKKLRNHIAGANETLRKSTSLVTRYSSGEESDSVDNGSKWKKKSRITVSGSPAGQMPPPKAYSQPAATRANQRQTPPVVVPPRPSYSPNTSKKSSVYVSPVIINDSENEDNSWRGINSQPTYSSRTSYSNSRDYGTSHDSPSYRNGNSNGYSEDDGGDDSTSETTKRLLQLRQHISTANNNNSAQTGSSFRKRTSYGSGPRDIVYQADPSLDSSSHKNLTNRLDFKQNFVPMFLVSLVVVFFTLVIFCYFQISPNIQTFLTPSTTSYVACGDQQLPDGVQTCIEETSLDSALNLLKTIAPELQQRAIGSRCGDKTVPSPYVCVREFGRLITDAQNFMNIHDDTKNIEYLIDRNPQWGISNIDAKGQVLTLEQVAALQPQQYECFGILDPKLPLTCRIRNKIHTYFTIIGSLAVAIVLGFIFWKFYQWILFVKRRRIEQIDHIIRKICSELKERAGHEGSSVVVNHLRDKIIDPAKRSELASAWNEAIAYLEHNDSRIHFGVECVNGEDFKVMQWIDEPKANSGDQSRRTINVTPKKYQETPTQHYATTKKWMGSAFDKSNKIKDPPTNCLKIRQMFNKFETSNPNLKTIIQDTILFKLKDRNCKLYDIQLDLKSCCVYVKCATCVDAGIVHEEINGWWLETEMVVVKFLKLDKYHSRFPESINASTPLHPSANVFITKSDNGTNGHDDFYDDGDDEYD